MHFYSYTFFHLIDISLNLGPFRSKWYEHDMDAHDSLVFTLALWLLSLITFIISIWISSCHTTVQLFEGIFLVRKAVFLIICPTAVHSYFHCILYGYLVTSTLYMEKKAEIVYQICTYTRCLLYQWHNCIQSFCNKWRQIHGKSSFQLTSDEQWYMDTEAKLCGFSRGCTAGCDHGK